MRGETERQATLMLGLTPEAFVPSDHPLRRIKPLVDSALGRMSPVFEELYAAGGRPSVPPEQLLKASLLMACYTIRSERQFCEQLRYNILFKWFLDRNVEDEPFHPTTFTKNRERLHGGGRGAGVAQGGRQGGAPPATCSRLTTSRSTARCSRPGPRTRATVRATSGPRAGAGATLMLTSPLSGGAARRTSRPPIRRRGSTARAGSRARSSAISVTC